MNADRPRHFDIDGSVAEDSSQPQVRDATLADVPDLARVHLRAATTAYREIIPPDVPAPTESQLAAEWEAALTDASPAAVLVGAVGERVIGTVAVRPFPDDPRFGQLRRLYVEPAFWRRGIGTLLHDAALHRLRSAGFSTGVLWVLEHNHAARTMYERRGWKVVPDRIKHWPQVDITEVQYGVALR